MHVPNRDSGTPARARDAGRRWLGASAVVYQRLLATDGADVGDALRVIAETACEWVDADLAAVLLPTGENTGLRVEVAVGCEATGLQGQTVAVVTGSSPAPAPGSAVPGGWQPAGCGPVCLSPLPGPRPGGALVLGRLRGAPAFTDEDVDVAADLAVHAAAALTLVQSRTEAQQAAVLADRDRIATQLHNDVLRQLFATGMALQSVASGLGPGPAADRLQNAVIELDRTINHIQQTVFSLYDRGAGDTAGAGARLVDAIAGLTAALGFEPTTQVTGSLDALSADVVTDLIAAVREALTNVGRHARARAAEVRVTVAKGVVALQVTDDGIGFTGAPAGGGLADLRRRARWHGGSLTVQSGASGGTRLAWTVPTP